MSYATYLQNKMAAQQKVVAVRPTTDASMATYKTRLEANRVFFVDGKGVGTLAVDTSSPEASSHPSTSFKKDSNRPADASDYTAYRGGQAIGTDAPYNTPGGFKSIPCIPAPTPTPAKYRGAGDQTKMTIALCNTSNALREPPRFVDNTIRLSAMQPDTLSGTCCVNGLTKAIHDHSPGLPAVVRPTVAQHVNSAVSTGATDASQNPGVGGKKVGGYFNPRSRFVENKHGNDLGVNPRRVPTDFVPTAGAPAHLKINDPKFGNVKA